MRTIFLLAYGLLPVWVAFSFIAFAFVTMRPDHAGMSMWALVPAIPACAVTLLIGGIATTIHSRVAGDLHRKLRASGAFVGAASLVLIAVGVAHLLKRQGNATDLQLEKTRVEEFVKGNAEVRAAAGEPLRASIASYSFGRSESMPVLYDVSVTGSKTVYAIVEINRRSKQPQFKLKCTTSLYMGQRDPHKDPCKQ